MYTPEQHPELNPEVSVDNRNGFGYWVFTPDSPKSFDERVMDLSDFGDLSELSDVVLMAEEHGSVLVNGAPGAGKSHLVRELQQGAVINNIPTLCLTVHINAGKRDGIENIRETYDAFVESVDEGQGIVILDNVDYLGYKGKSRRRSAAADYASSAKYFIDEILEDERLVVIATAHDDDWREGRWVWDDPEIDIPAHEVMESFDSRMVFEGRMSLVGLAHILHDRGYGLGESARTIRELHGDDKALFFYANHIDVGRFLIDPDVATEEIEAGRAERSRTS